MPKPISESDRMKLYRYLAAHEQQNFGATYNLVLYQLLELTGLRSNEALNLKWEMYEDDALLLPDREVLLPNKAIHLLSYWRAKYWPPDEELEYERDEEDMEEMIKIFPHNHGAEDAEKQFQYWLKKASIEEQDYTLESFRLACEEGRRLSGLPNWFMKHQFG